MPEILFIHLLLFFGGSVTRTIIQPMEGNNLLFSHTILHGFMGIIFNGHFWLEFPNKLWMEKPWEVFYFYF